MAEQTVPATEKATDRAVQRCILPRCEAVYGIRERIYVCPGCGGPLEIDFITGYVGDVARRFGLPRL